MKMKGKFKTRKESMSSVHAPQSRKQLNALIGKRFDMLTVIKRTKYKASNKAYLYLCRCDCGRYILRESARIKGKKEKSCGCYNRIKDITHGLTTHPLFNIWNQYKVKHDIFREWENDFMAFYNWCMENGWSDDKALVKKDRGKCFTPVNILIGEKRLVSLHQKMKGNNKSGYTGISFCKSYGKWCAYITVRGERFNLGRYEDILDAINARNNFIISNNLTSEYNLQKFKHNPEKHRKIYLP